MYRLPSTQQICTKFRIFSHPEYPDQLLDMLSDASVYSALDLALGYHQLRIIDSDIQKTSFNKCKFRQFESVVLPFGLSNAPIFTIAPTQPKPTNSRACMIFCRLCATCELTTPCSSLRLGTATPLTPLLCGNSMSPTALHSMPLIHYWMAD